MGLWKDAFKLRTLEYLLWVLAAACVALYLIVAAARMTYPFELEWMEGGVVDHVRRVLAGRDLYIEPSIEFTPFIYPPLYYYVGTAFSKVLGIGFFPLRLVSFLSSLGSMAIVFLFVRRESGSATGGLLAAGLFAATFRAAGAWYDLARIDSLFLFLLLAGAYLLRFRPGVRTHMAAGVLIWLSALTKQTAVAVDTVMCLYSVVCLPGRLKFVYPVTFAALVAAGTVVLDAAAGGWYWYYVFGPAGNHNIGGSYFWKFWTHDVGAPVAVAAATSLYYLVHLVRNGRNPRAVFYWLLAAGMIGASWVARMHMGGYNNVLMPAYAAIALCFGLGVAVRMSMSRARVWVLILCAVQFVVLLHDPRDQIPSDADRQAGRRLVGVLEALDGEILMPQHGYLPALAGKKTCAHEIAIWDILRGGDPDVANKLMQEISTAIYDGRFQAIVLDRPLFYMEVLPNYTRSRTVFVGDAFWPVTGKRTRPQDIFERDR
jgi:4-amino-4-deoxy-L-arabinose transferase-like glycosyltransferase